MNPVFVRSLVYAGLISNSLAIAVCLLFKELDYIPDSFMNLSVWLFSYLFNKKRGTW